MSDESLHQKITEFISGELARKAERQCIGIDLLYAPPGYRDERLKTWERADEPEKFEQLVLVEQMVSQIVEIAEGHADTFGSGSHQYVIRTRQHLGGRLTHRFRISPQYSSSDQALMAQNGNATASSGPSGEALQILSQNNQAFMRTNQAMFTASFGTLATLSEGMRDENIKLKSENSMLRRQLDEAMSIKEDREFETAMKAEKNARTNAGFNKLLQIGTVVAAKIAGGDMSKEGASAAPINMLIADFTKSLRKDQIASLFQILDSGQQMLLFEIMNMAARLQDADGVWFHGYSEPLQQHSSHKWGRANGWQIGDRGRIPQEILDAYAAAN